MAAAILEQCDTKLTQIVSTFNYRVTTLAQLFRFQKALFVGY